jgi:hypothetical protein
MRAYLFCVIYLLSCVANYTAAQNTTDLDARYDAYRGRFLSEFVAVAPRFTDYVIDSTNPTEPARSGWSVPASEIRSTSPWLNELPGRMREAAQCTDHNMRFADATSHLGYYIAVLATEYARFKAEGKPTAFTAAELYKAMKSYERLDVSAEYFFGLTNKPKSANGFFMRDDIVPEYYYRRFQDGKNGRGDMPSPYCVFGDFAFDDYGPEGGEGPHNDQKCSKNLQKADNPMSQDQCIWLLMGFSLANKVFLNEGVMTLKDAANETVRADLAAMARNYATLILQYISTSGSAANNGWGIRYPGTKDYVPRGGFSLELGFDSYGFAQAGWNLNKFKTKHPMHASWVLSYAYFQSLKRKGALVYQAENQKFNRSMLMCLAALGDGFRDNRDVAALWTFTTLGVLTYPIAPTFYLFASRAIHCAEPNRCRSVTLKCLNDLGKEFQLPLYSMIHRYLYDKTLPERNDTAIFNQAARYLALAPEYGPCFAAGTVRQSAPWPWTVANIHQYIYKAPNHPPTEKESGAAFNGLDFMLLYNMYKLTSPK